MAVSVNPRAVRPNQGGMLSTAVNLADYASLRSYSGRSKSAYITGYAITAAPSGVAGAFTRDDSDTSSSDNAGTIIVANNGARWKRVTSGAWVSVLWFGADPTNTNDSESAFDAAVATGKAVYVPKGTYKFSGVSSGITLSDGQMIFGDGPQSLIHHQGAGACITMGNRSVVKDLGLQGKGKATGGSYTTQRGVTHGVQKRGWRCEGVYATDFAGTGADNQGGAFYSHSTLINADPSYIGGVFSNCYAYSNACGFHLDNRGEYNSVVGCRAFDNTIGIRVDGGNNVISTSNFSGNTTNCVLTTGSNDGHGSFSSCLFNHGATSNLEVTNVTEGMVFSACFFYAGNITITDSKGIRFMACDLSASGGTLPLNFTLAGTCGPVLIGGGSRFPTSGATALTQALNGNTLTVSTDAITTPF